MQQKNTTHVPEAQGLAACGYKYRYKATGYKYRYKGNSLSHLNLLEWS